MLIVVTRGSPSNPAATCCKQTTAGEQSDAAADEQPQIQPRRAAKQPMDCEEFSHGDGLAPGSEVALVDVELEGMAAALAAYFAAGSKQGHRRRPGCPTNSMARSTHLNGVSEPNASMDVQVNRGSAFDVDGGPKCFRPKYKIPARATPTRSRPPGNSASSRRAPPVLRGV